MFDPFDEHTHDAHPEDSILEATPVRCTICGRNERTTHYLDLPAECATCDMAYCKDCRENAGTCPTCAACGHVTRWAS